MKRTHRFALLVYVLMALAAGSLWTLNNLHVFSRAAPFKSSPPLPAVKDIDTAALDPSIANILAQNPNLDVSISIADITNGKTYSYGESAGFVAASTTKLLSAAMYLHEIEAGRASLDDPIGNYPARLQLEKLIVNSDNAAWHAFRARLGEPNLENYAHQTGMSSYIVSTNTVTSSDMTLLLAMLYKNQLINYTHKQLLLSYMSRASEPEYIPAAVTNGAKVYHKAGWLEDRFHDVAIIDNGTHAYALVIFSKTHGGPYSSSRGITMFHAITKTINTAFVAAN